MTVSERGVFKTIDVILVFLLLTLNIFYTFFSVPIVYFEKVNELGMSCQI